MKFPQFQNSITSCLLVDVGESALTAVVAITVTGHEGPGAAVGVGALLAEALHLAGVVDLVELEDGELDLLLLVLDLLGFGVGLLLPLLSHAAAEAEDEVEGALLLDVVVGEGPAILELFSGEDQALLVRGNALLVLDLGFHIVDGVGGFNF